MRKLQLLLLCAIVICGCAKEEPIPPENAPPQGTSAGEPVGYVKTLDEVKALSLSAPASYSPNAATKSAAKTIKEVMPLTSLLGAQPQTRSASVSGDVKSAVNNIYVVNYENEAGFSVISADNRLPDVLAYSDHGNIPQDINGIEVPGVASFFKALPAYAQREVEQVNSVLKDYTPGDSIPDGDGYFRTNIRMEWTPWSMLIEKGPVLATRWHQGSPLDRFLPDCSPGTKPKAGCAAVAIAQIVAYHGFPPTIHSDYLNRDITPNWPSILALPMPDPLKQEDVDAVSALSEMIGKYAGTEYGYTESSTIIYNIPYALKMLGYTCDHMTQTNLLAAVAPFNSDNLWLSFNTSINKFYPALVMGNNSTTGKGHGWVVDGTKHRQRAYQWVADLYDSNWNYVGIETRVEHDEYYCNLLHCIWGWDTTLLQYDGYYTAGAFDPIPGTFSYNSNNTMITGIKPNL